jgi:hypothetical protein
MIWHLICLVAEGAFEWMKPPPQNEKNCLARGILRAKLKSACELTVTESARIRTRQKDGQNSLHFIWSFQSDNRGEMNDHFREFGGLFFIPAKS